MVLPYGLNYPSTTILLNENQQTKTFTKRSAKEDPWPSQADDISKRNGQSQSDNNYVGQFQGDNNHDHNSHNENNAIGKSEQSTSGCKQQEKAWLFIFTVIIMKIN